MDFLGGVLSSVPTWIASSIVLGALLYWYLTRNHGYWRKVGIPYVPAVPLFGSTLQFFLEPMHEVEVRRYKENGRIYGSFEGTRPVIVMGELDILRDILVKDFQFFTGRRFIETGNPLSDRMVQNLQGEDWKRIRAIMTPAFTTGKIKRMVSIFIDSAKTISNNFRTAAKQGKPVDMKTFFGAFTMDVIASSAFGTKIDSHNDPTNVFAETAKATFRPRIPWRFLLFFLFPGLIKILKINIFSPSALEFFKSATLKIMEERKRTGKKRNDFLQLLIDSSDEREKNEFVSHDEKEDLKEMGHEEGNEQVFKPYYLTKSLTNEEVIAQCIIFFLAGYDTTASTLSFTAYELALNPDVQERAIAEIDGIIEKKGELNYEAIAEMKYLDNVLSETLRKYPVAVRTERRCEEEYEIKGHDIIIPKGMMVGVPIYAIHHDPQNYPDPKKYDPDRFTPEQKASRHSYAYLPFGAGPRNCVGMRFALMEAKVCLAFVLRHFRFVTCSQTQVPLKYMNGQGLMQPKEVLLQVQIREDAKKL